MGWGPLVEGGSQNMGRAPRSMERPPQEIGEDPHQGGEGEVEGGGTHLCWGSQAT